MPRDGCVAGSADSQDDGAAWRAASDGGGADRSQQSAWPTPLRAASWTPATIDRRAATAGRRAVAEQPCGRRGEQAAATVPAGGRPGGTDLHSCESCRPTAPWMREKAWLTDDEHRRARASRAGGGAGRRRGASAGGDYGTYDAVRPAQPARRCRGSLLHGAVASRWSPSACSADRASIRRWSGWPRVVDPPAHRAGLGRWQASRARTGLEPRAALHHGRAAVHGRDDRRPGR